MFEILLCYGNFRFSKIKFTNLKKINSVFIFYLVKNLVWFLDIKEVFSIGDSYF